MIAAGYAILIFMSASGASEFGETYMPQLPDDPSSAVMMEQLPETAVVPTQQATEPTGTHTKKPAAKAPAQAARLRVAAMHSIFPNVGGGVTARADPAPSDKMLPTVGPGTATN
jgi:hypothetical protein